LSNLGVEGVDLKKLVVEGVVGTERFNQALRRFKGVVGVDTAGEVKFGVRGVIGFEVRAPVRLRFVGSIGRIVGIRVSLAGARSEDSAEGVAGSGLLVSGADNAEPMSDNVSERTRIRRAGAIAGT
jgi:hypothetical protein